MSNNKQFKVIYRVSNKGRDKNKLPNATKEHCLENARDTFGLNSIHVIADNCSPDLVNFIRENGFDYEETSLGNIGSFQYALNNIISKLDDECVVYMLEDDYIHLPDSKAILFEGLQIADYVTLFDHNDSYMDRKDGGSPFNHNGFHRWRIYTTKSTHWRELPSTTMTVAAKAHVFKADSKIWNDQPAKGIPKDFSTWMLLTKQKEIREMPFAFKNQKTAALNMLKNWFTTRKARTLICPIPARSTHADLGYESPCVDWSKY